MGRVAGFLVSGFSSYIAGANLVVDGDASTVSVDGPYMSKLTISASHGLKECSTSLELVPFIPFLCCEDLAQGM